MPSCFHSSKSSMGTSFCSAQKNSGYRQVHHQELQHLLRVTSSQVKAQFSPDFFKTLKRIHHLGARGPPETSKVARGGARTRFQEPDSQARAPTTRRTVVGMAGAHGDTLAKWQPAQCRCPEAMTLRAQAGDKQALRITASRRNLSLRLERWRM